MIATSLVASHRRISQRCAQRFYKTIHGFFASRSIYSNVGENASRSTTRVGPCGGIQILWQQQQQQHNHQRHRVGLSGWTGARGHDLTAESLSVGGDKPKVIVTAMAPTGFDVQNCVKRVVMEGNVPQNDAVDESNTGVIHMNGSIVLFPHACFLWNVRSAEDVTLESLSPVLLHSPKIDYLFIGLDHPAISTPKDTSSNNHRHASTHRMTVPNLSVIQETCRQKFGLFVEVMGLSNAMGTFNILNAEDRSVAAALVMYNDDDDDEVQRATLPPKHLLPKEDDKSK